LSTIRDCLFNTLQLPSTSGGRLLHLQPDDAPCNGDRVPHDKVERNDILMTVIVTDVCQSIIYTARP